MNFKRNLYGNLYVIRPLVYAVAIGSAAAISYCTMKKMPMVNEPVDAGYKPQSADAGSNNLPENVLLEVGVYTGLVDGKLAEYKVEAGHCFLKLYVSASKSILIEDDDCDNTANSVSNYTRGDLEEVGRTEKFDALLREGQKLVRPKNNKGKQDLQKAIDDLLRP